MANYDTFEHFSRTSIKQQSVNENEGIVVVVGDKYRYRMVND